MEPRISIITLGVEDLERSAEFYKQLGLPTKGNEGGIVFFNLKGTWLALYPKKLLAQDAKVADNGAGFPSFTLAHNVRTTEEVDTIMKDAEAAGAVITDPAHDREWGGYSGYFKDPDGYLWEIAWNPHFWVE